MRNVFDYARNYGFYTPADIYIDAEDLRYYQNIAKTRTMEIAQPIEYGQPVSERTRRNRRLIADEFEKQIIEDNLNYLKRRNDELK